MFAKLSEFTRKYRVIIAAVWLAAAVILFLFAPKLSKVGVTDESQFLPQNTVIFVRRPRSSGIMPLCVGSRCGTRMNTNPVSGGKWEKNCSNASKPPADPPIPTT